MTWQWDHNHRPRTNLNVCTVVDDGDDVLFGGKVAGDYVGWIAERLVE